MAQRSTKGTNNIKRDQNIDPNFENAIKTLIKKELDNFSNYSGVNNESLAEIKTVYKQTSNETVINSKTNCFIILGSDRPGAEGSGYGGIGQSGAAAIDLVAGHLGSRPINNINGVPVPSSKSFSADAARVYISQMCDIDEYFNIPKRSAQIGSVTLDIEESTARSGVGIKADAVRFIGRETIKLVTSHLGNNSQEFPIDAGGVDIIAGYEIDDIKHSLQPMVKGDNLLGLLRAIVGLIEDVQANVNSFLVRQNAINTIVMHHSHQVHDTVTKPMISKGRKSALSKPLGYDQITQTEQDIKDQEIATNFFNNTSVEQYRNEILGQNAPSSSGRARNPVDRIFDLFSIEMEEGIKSLTKDTILEIITNNISFGNVINDYFNVSSPKYINSRYNRVN